VGVSQMCNNVWLKAVIHCSVLNDVRLHVDHPPATTPIPILSLVMFIMGMIMIILSAISLTPSPQLVLLPSLSCMQSDADVPDTKSSRGMTLRNRHGCSSCMVCLCRK
jgi:hypothetical protein